MSSPTVSIYGERLQSLGSTRFDEVRDSLWNVRDLRLQAKMTGEALDYFLGLMPNVTSLTLDLQRDHMGTVVPCPIGAWRTLTKLDLCSVGVSDDMIVAMVRSNSESLEELRLYLQGLSRRACEAIGDLTNLRHLCLLYGYQFDDSHFKKVVRNNPKLLSLLFTSFPLLTDASLTYIRDLKNIRRLNFSGWNKITSDGPCVLRAAPSLQHVELRFPTLTDGSLRGIAPLEDLRTLFVNIKWTSGSIDVLCDSFKKLETITLFCNSLTDDDGVKLGALKHLRNLTLYNCAGFTDRTFAQGIKSSALQHIRIHGSPFTDAGLMGLLRRQRNLRSLHLLHCPNITAKCIEELKSIRYRLSVRSIN